MTGIGFDRDTLIEAGIEQADAFAAVSSGDNSNIIAARVARETFGVEQVVARIYDPKRAEVYERLGIPTVATVRWAADQILRRLLPEGAAPEWIDASGNVVLAQVLVEPGLDRAAAVAAREGGRRAGRLHHPLRRGMLSRTAGPSCRTATCCTCSSPAASNVARGRKVRRARPRGPEERRHDATPASGWRSPVPATWAAPSRYELLDHGHEVLLIEREPAGDEAQAPSSGATWVHADACELATLETAELQDYDVVVAATGDDKVNLVVSLLAKTEFGVRRVVARVNHPKNEWLFNESWGVDVAVSTPRMLTALVEEAV